MSLPTKIIGNLEEKDFIVFPHINLNANIFWLNLVVDLILLVQVVSYCKKVDLLFFKTDKPMQESSTVAPVSLETLLTQL